MKSTCPWIILYDIRDIRRLRRVAKITESFATRVQKSVFEAYANMKTIEQLRTALKRELAEADTVAFIPLCSEDWVKCDRFGSASKTASKPEPNDPVFL